MSVLVALASVKGAPGVTSTALVLAAVWPRPVVLLEVDPAGGDLAYRCRAARGGPVLPSKGLLTLAAAVRGGSPGPQVLLEHGQVLESGVSLVQGVTSTAQGRGLVNLWPTIAEACRGGEIDVIADLGRLDRSSPVMPLAQAADCLLPVSVSSLESVMHLMAGLHDLTGVLSQHGMTTIRPVLVGPDAHSQRDCEDLDGLLAKGGQPAEATMAVPVDARALNRLEAGEQGSGRLGRTLLLRAARALARSMVALDEPVVAQR